jgi:hypothetical protein
VPADDIADFFAHSQAPAKKRDPVLEEAGLPLVDPLPLSVVPNETASTDYPHPSRLGVFARLLGRGSKPA